MDGSPLTPSREAEQALLQQLQERLAQGRLALPTLPDLALRIDAIVGSEDAGAAEVAHAIAQDPATAARLIQAANSAYAASRVRVQSTQGAVTRLGLAYTRALVHRVALEQMFLARALPLQKLAQASWSTSLEVAALAEALARSCSDLAPETAMTAGLLHRVGVLPLIRLLDEAPELLPDEEAIPPMAAALAPTLGHTLLERWQFPRLLQEIPELTASAAYHHTGPADYADLVLAARFSTERAAGRDAAAPTHALEKLGLDSQGAFLERPVIQQALAAARERLAC